MAKHDSVTGWYSTVLKGWQSKLLGPKVTPEQLAAAHALGCRPGKQALAMAMYLRDGGASDGQVKAACIIQWGSSGSHHNKRRDMVDQGFARAKPVVNDAQGHKVYAITLTAKGDGKVKAAAEKAAAEPAPAAKAKAAPKPRKAKATPAAVVAHSEPQPAADQPNA